jgi:DNA replication licensing factor MCM3
MYYCAFIGSFGEFSCNPRTLSSVHLNHMISLEGIVTKCSLVRPKVVQSVHYCEDEGVFWKQDYRDQTNTASGMPTTTIYPTEDRNKHPVRHTSFACVLTK